MSSTLFRTICRFLIAALLLSSFGSVRAGMIGADELSAAGMSSRSAVIDVLARPEVAAQLQAQGIDPQAARERVAALSNDEVQALQGQLDALPAGASSSGAGWAVAVVVVLVVWWLWFR
jgi:hypothetical protein